MKIIFMGGHTLGSITLQNLIDKGKDIVGVVTSIEDEWYRGVDKVAEQRGIMLYKNVDVNSEDFIDTISKLDPDLIVVVNFQQILKEKIISLPKMGCINTHASLLPKYRGRAPLNWALIHGEKQVGVTVHFVEKGIDTGDIILQHPIDIGVEEYIDTVIEKVSIVYPDIVNSAIDSIQSTQNIGKKQNLSEGSYFGKRTADDGKINWNNNVIDIFNLIRAVSRPYPGAFSFYKKSKIIIWKAKIIDQSFNDAKLPNGYIIAAGNNELIIKAESGNILVTDYEAIGEKKSIKEGETLISGE